jgi:uncharacterized protein YjgD (DUF1641 family)
MSEKNIQLQIDEINRKLDIILEETLSQRQNREAVTDLVDDVAIVGKDAFKGMVNSLDNAGIELDPESVNHLVMGLIRNIDNFNMLLSTLESATDFVKDASPIIKQVGIDGVAKFNEYEQKGYFNFLSEFGHIIDNIVEHYSVEDVRMLADNIVVIMDTVKNLTQPQMLKSIDNAIRIFAKLEMDNIPEYSIFKVMRELNKPEMKKAFGFMITFMKNLSKNTISNNN